MRISFIAALDRNGVIGHRNSLPWRMPSDQRRFRRLTLDKPVVMGRRTYDSIGKALARRTNIVVTREPDFEAPGCLVVHSVEEALAAARCADEVMVIGGGQIYRQLLPRAERMYLTRIDGEFEGDAHFPEWDADEWREIDREDHEADDENPHRYSFVTLERKRS